MFSPVLFALYTSGFHYNSELCHVQKFADNTAIVDCVRDEQALRRRKAAWLDKLVRKAGSVVGTELESLTSMAEQRTLNRLLSIMDNTDHPLNSTISRQTSSFSDRLLSLKLLH